MSNQADAIKRLEEAGLNIIVEDGRALIEEPFPGSPFFETIGKSFDYYTDHPVEVGSIRNAKERIAKEIFYIPAILFLGLVYRVQRQRKEKPEMD